MARKFYVTGNTLLIICSCLLFVFFCSKVHADTFELRDALSMGVEIEESFDTNIFNTYDLINQHDFVTRVRPRITLDLNESNFFSKIYRKDRNNKRSGRGSSGSARGSGSFGERQFSSGEPGRADVVPGIKIGLELDLEYYALHPKLNSVSSGDNFFQPDFDVELNPDEGLRLYYRFNRTRNNISGLDPLGSAEESEKVYTSTHRYGVDYDFGPKRDVWNFSYQHTKTDNEDTDDLDRDQDTWSLDINMTDPPSYLPKVFGEYSGSRSSGGAGGEKTTHEGFLGLRGNFSPKISGEVKGGYGISSPSKDLFKFSDLTGELIYDLSLNYNVSNRLDLGVTFDKTQRNITSFTIDRQDGDSGGSALNIPRSTSDSWNLSLNAAYTPPFFGEDLRLNGTLTHSEIEYSDGSTQKVQEIGLGYTYTFRGIQSKRFRAAGSGRNRNDRGENNRQVNPVNKSGDDRNLFIFLDALSIRGDIKTRRVSPDTAWSRFNDNEITINIKWEL